MQMQHVLSPAIVPTLIIMMILYSGNFLDTGFEQIFMLTNSLNREVADVFDTYVYFMGITNGAYSYSTAIGLFKGIVGLILILGANRSEEHTSELQSRGHLVCRLLLEKKKHTR